MPYRYGNVRQKLKAGLISGHWEGDLMSGSKNSHIALVERHSRFVMLVQVNGKDTANVVSALVQQVKVMAFMAT